MEGRPVRCAIYTRQSVARENDDFTSCDAQREACLEHVRAHALEGWIPIDERFDDAGESGATLDRPGLQRLLDRVREGAVDLHLGDLAMSDLVLNVLATFAEFERELIGERLRDARAARAALRSRGLRKPSGDLSPDAEFVLTRYAPIWEVLFPETVRRAVAQLVWEVRWDGIKDQFAVMLDETAIAEERAKIRRNDEERVNPSKPRGHRQHRGP